MISYFIVAHCTFTKNFTSKLKFQFQVIFGQDFFPLKMSPFQVRLLHNFTNCLLANGWHGGIHAFPITLFLQRFPISSRRHLLCHKIFLFGRTGSFCAHVFPDYSFVTTKRPVFFSIYACRWLLLNNSSMISNLIFLNKFFLHLDADSTS